MNAPEPEPEPEQKPGAGAGSFTFTGAPMTSIWPRHRTAILLGSLVLGPLAGNPFPDATSDFFTTMGRALSLGLAYDIAIDAPFATQDKSAVVRLGVELGVPLELTLSCMNPQSGFHCGQCSKCRERRDAFDTAGIADPTPYAAASPRTAQGSGLKA